MAKGFCKPLIISNNLADWAAATAAGLVESLPSRKTTAQDHVSQPLPTTRAGMAPPACLPRRAVAAALGCGGDDAARERGGARRAGGGARDGVPRAADHTQGDTAPGPGAGGRTWPGGLAGLEPARDAPAARPRYRHARDADLAPGTRHGAGREPVAECAPRQ